MFLRLFLAKFYSIFDDKNCDFDNSSEKYDYTDFLKWPILALIYLWDDFFCHHFHNFAILLVQVLPKKTVAILAYLANTSKRRKSNKL